MDEKAEAKSNQKIQTMLHVDSKGKKFIFPPILNSQNTLSLGY